MNKQISTSQIHYQIIQSTYTNFFEQFFGIIIYSSYICSYIEVHFLIWNGGSIQNISRPTIFSNW